MAVHKLGAVLLVVLVLAACLPQTNGSTDSASRGTPFEKTDAATVVPDTVAPPASTEVQGLTSTVVAQPTACPGKRLLFTYYLDPSPQTALMMACLDSNSKVIYTREVIKYVDSSGFAVSSNGSLLAIQPDGTAKLFDSNGTELRTLFDSDIQPGRFSFSPDGQYLIYARRNPSMDSLFPYLWEILHLASGTVSSVLLEKDMHFPNLNPQSATWLPSGNKIGLYSVWELGASLDILEVQCQESTHICTTGQIQHIMSPDNTPSWSPDGEKIAFFCHLTQNDPENICIYSQAGDLIRSFSLPALGLTTGRGRLSWSPDGTELAFAALSKSNSPSSVYVLSLAGGLLHLITPDQDHTFQSPVWLPLAQP